MARTCPLCLKSGNTMVEFRRISRWSDYVADFACNRCNRVVAGRTNPPEVCRVCQPLVVVPVPLWHHTARCRHCYSFDTRVTGTKATYRNHKCNRCQRAFRTTRIKTANSKPWNPTCQCPECESFNTRTKFTEPERFLRYHECADCHATWKTSSKASRPRQAIQLSQAVTVRQVTLTELAVVAELSPARERQLIERLSTGWSIVTALAAKQGRLR